MNYEYYEYQRQQTGTAGQIPKSSALHYDAFPGGTMVALLMPGVRGKVKPLDGLRR
jgi:hypothetical protein